MMKQQSVWKTMSKPHRYITVDIFLAYLVMGIYLILIGSALPSMKAEYHISYQTGGLMMSAQQIGYLTMGLLTSTIAAKFGAKRSYLITEAFALIGLALMMFFGNPWVLLFAMLLTGLAKGCTGNFGNQIVSNVSGGDAGMLNLAQAFFAVGACAAPIIALVCGASWRMSFVICIVTGVIVLLHGVRVHIGHAEFAQEAQGKTDFGFFRHKLFWLCVLMLLSYLAVETCFMGWTVTYFVDSGTVDEPTAQMMATLLWVAVLIGRFGSAYLSARFQPHHMILAMIAGMIVCFTLLMFGNTFVLMAIGTMGCGMFMGGMYGTTLGGSDDLMERYPMCMGMFIAIPGAGAALTSSIVGTLADRVGIRNGMLFLYVLIVLLAIVSVLFAIYHEKKNA